MELWSFWKFLNVRPSYKRFCLFKICYSTPIKCFVYLRFVIQHKYEDWHGCYVGSSVKLAGHSIILFTWFKMSAQCHEHARPVLCLKFWWIIQGKSFHLPVSSFFSPSPLCWRILGCSFGNIKGLIISFWASLLLPQNSTEEKWQINTIFHVSLTFLRRENVS